ncbi:MAG: hypothetical protein K0Q66_2161, partial [Chitinophagaceae bacterium]|nr:hypothetical protein [Chitinophagaceae bacterium]
MIKTILLIPILLFVLADRVNAQDKMEPVHPVLSADYLSLLKKDTLVRRGATDSAGDLNRSKLARSGGYYFGLPLVKTVKITGNEVTLVPGHLYRLSISGNYTATVETKSINRQPALQSTFAQGRSIAGQLAWQSPEMGEQFSFGPLLEQLEFDGTSYPYDINGRLVAKGTGNDHPAISYKSSIFRPAFLLSQSVIVKANVSKDTRQLFYLSAVFGKSDEATFIKKNRNSSGNVNLSGGLKSKAVNIYTSWQHNTQRFTNSNRNGFLNRTYMQSLLTPASFDNEQGILLAPGVQRSYSNHADNPLFLLSNRGDGYRLAQNNIKLSADKRLRHLSLLLSQSYEWIDELHEETYEPGTTRLTSGSTTHRGKKGQFYNLSAQALYDVRYNFEYDLSSQAGIKYFFSNNNSRTSYDPTVSYPYQRNAHEVVANYYTHYYLRDQNLDLRLNLSNKMYFSNTVRNGNAFLPGLDASIEFTKLFNARYLRLKLATGFNRFCSEIPVNRSHQDINLTILPTADVLAYVPLKEATSLDNLKAAQHKESFVRFELAYKEKFILSGGINARQVSNDVFPVIEAGTILLKNLASHRTRSFNLQLELNNRFRQSNLYTKNTLSILGFRNKVTAVATGYDQVAIAGFSDVHKSIIPGQPLGVIKGNRFLKDANANLVIGNDGFPLVDPHPGIIADPTPDFVMKLSNGLSWKNFQLAADLEWKKGGQTWNGTQAVLDYFGRSENSAKLRDTRDYIFAGVRQDGSINNVPVSFYDPALPIEQNRWVRYGFSGVAEEYVENSDHLR